MWSRNQYSESIISVAQWVYISSYHDLMHSIKGEDNRKKMPQAGCRENWNKTNPEERFEKNKWV